MRGPKMAEKFNFNNEYNMNIYEGDRMEMNIMPGWAGSSWYFLRF